jgi:hypothetical protein
MRLCARQRARVSNATSNLMPNEVEPGLQGRDCSPELQLLLINNSRPGAGKDPTTYCEPSRGGWARSPQHVRVVWPSIRSHGGRKLSCVYALKRARCANVFAWCVVDAPTRQAQRTLYGICVRQDGQAGVDGDFARFCWCTTHGCYQAHGDRAGRECVACAVRSNC